MRRVKYRVPQRVFALKEEKILHVFFIAATFLFPTIALVRKDINESNGSGTMCFIASSPHDCGRDGHPDCVRGPDADIYAGIFGAVGGTVFICLLIVLGMFTHHVYSIERQLASTTAKSTSKKDATSSNIEQSQDANSDSNNASLHSQTSNQDTESQESQKENAENLSQNDEEEGQSQENEENESDESNEEVEDNEDKTSLARKALNQSLLYIVAFLLIYMPGMIQVIFKMARMKSVADSQIFLWWTSFFYPLGGIFNILIYTRPKVHKLLEQLPHMPYFIGLLIVILAGGEVPSMAYLGIMRTPDSVTENFKDNNEEEEMRQQAIEQLEVKIIELSSFMRNVFGLNGSDLSSFDSQDLKSSIGPSELHMDESNLNALSFDTTSNV